MIDRRQFLVGALGSLVLSRLRNVAAVERALLEYVASPQDLGTPTEYFDRLIIPNDVFFVRSHFGPPGLDMSRRLLVDGLVGSTLDLSVSELKKFPEVSVTSVLQCAGNGRALYTPRVPGVQWVHGAMGQAKWTGVRLRDVLQKAGIKPEAKFVHIRGADNSPGPQVPTYLRSLPIERALDETTLFAYRMNGEPLTLAHGAPLRLVVPGWAGDHWMKWLTSIRLETKEPDGFYFQTAYRMPIETVTPGAAVPPEKMKPLTVVPVKSIIGRPTDNGAAKRGAQEVVGIAFSGGSAIKLVEVSTDGGTNWKSAKLEGEPGAGRWQVFKHEFKAEKPGKYMAMARATDRAGNIQPKDPAWNPSGYFWNGWHSVSWTVA